MLMPSIFRDNFFDDFMGYPFSGFGKSTGVGKSDCMAMRTDIKETDAGYEVTMDLPGFKKEDVKGELKDGYLTISASTDSAKDEKDQEGRYIRRERYSGSYSRSFFVGEDVTQEDIKAKFEDGTLKVMIPKVERKPAVEEKKYIAIEG